MTTTSRHLLIAVAGGVVLSLEQWWLGLEKEEEKDEDDQVVGVLKAKEETFSSSGEVVVLAAVGIESCDHHFLSSDLDVSTLNPFMPSFLTVSFGVFFSLLCLESINVFESIAERGLEAEPFDMSRVVAFDRRFVKTPPAARDSRSSW